MICCNHPGNEKSNSQNSHLRLTVIVQWDTAVCCQSWCSFFVWCWYRFEVRLHWGVVKACSSCCSQIHMWLSSQMRTIHYFISKSSCRVPKENVISCDTDSLMSSWWVHVSLRKAALSHVNVGGNTLGYNKTIIKYRYCSVCYNLKFWKFWKFFIYLFKEKAKVQQMFHHLTKLANKISEYMNEYINEALKSGHPREIHVPSNIFPLGAIMFHQNLYFGWRKIKKIRSANLLLNVKDTILLQWSSGVQEYACHLVGRLFYAVCWQHLLCQKGWRP